MFEWNCSCVVRNVRNAAIPNAPTGTRGPFGSAVDPRLFGDCANTSVAIQAPKSFRMVMLVLGYAVLRTSKDACNQAERFQAFGVWHALIFVPLDPAGSLPPDGRGQCIGRPSRCRGGPARTAFRLVPWFVVGGLPTISGVAYPAARGSAAAL